MRFWDKYLSLKILFIPCVFAYVFEIRQHDSDIVNEALILLGNNYKQDILKGVVRIDFSNHFIDKNIYYENKDVFEYHTFNLIMRKLKGFKVKSFPIFVSYSGLGSFYLEMSQMNLIDEKNQPVNISSSTAILSKYLGLDSFNQNSTQFLFNNFFGLFSIDALMLSISASVNFKDSWSPLLFKDCTIGLLNTHRFINTTICRNYMKFNIHDDILDSSSSLDLNSFITNLDLTEIYNIYLSSEMLNKHVFKQLSIINIFLHLNSIEKETFKEIRNLFMLNLKIFNFREFWHSSNEHMWLRSLNYYVKVNLTAIEQLNDEEINTLASKTLFLIFDQKKKAYSYPDEDFCLFRNFPHDQLVFPMFIDSSNKTDNYSMLYYNVTTCLQAFLVMNTKLIHILNSGTNKFIFYPSNLTDYCNIEHKLKQCETKGFTIKELKTINFDKVIYLFNWLQFVGPIATFPLISFFGFITNLLIVITIIKNKEKNKKKVKSLNAKDSTRMNEFMFYNSFYNMIECLISSTTLLSECLGYNSIFCSSVMEEDAVIYYKIYVVSYFGEVMKTCSLLTAIGFSLERYFLTSDTELKFLSKIKNLNIKLLNLVFLGAGLISSYPKVAEYEDNYLPYLGQVEFPKLNIYKMKSILWFVVVYSLHYAINDFILLMVTIFIDILLVINIKKNLRKKKKIQLSLKDDKENEKKKKMKLIKVAQKDSNKLIIYSSSVYIICRLPELVFYISFLFPVYQEVDFYIFSQFAVNVIEYLYVISYSTTIFFYLKFNKQFYNDFIKLFCLKKTKK